MYQITCDVAVIGGGPAGLATAITAAREAYNALTAEEKAQVSNYSVLTAAEVAFDGLANQKNRTHDHASCGNEIG